MAADKRTAFLMAYKELVLFIPFLSTFFLTRPRDIVNAESFEIDIMRGTRKLAPVISNITQKGGKIQKSIYTNKEFTPPVVALGSDFASGDLINKAFGKDRYESAVDDYIMQLQEKIADTMMEIESQIMRTIEYQASQIFQTGTVTLKDENGNDAFTISFSPKATHFPTVTTNWSDSNSDPDADIISLYNLIKKDGKANARNIIFGSTALTNYLRNAKVVDKFDNRNFVPGQVDPNEINPDVNYLGELLIGAKRFKCWLYEGLYENSSGNDVPFIAEDKVVLLPDSGAMNFDMRKVFCRVPTITGVDPRFEQIVPSNIQLENRSYTNRVWVNGDSDTLNLELKTRPLLVPVSIDSFGCIKTEA